MKQTYSYYIECVFCRKIFKIQKLDYRLKPHQDSFGNICEGRTGYLKNNNPRYEY